MAATQLTRTHRILIGVVVAGAVVIAGIGFAGSYAAVRELALNKGFGNFSYVFPIGVDAGICVLLALDLLLTWMRIPFPLLRQTAWLLTAATIAFNGAAAWPDPLGVGMHAVIPVLFVVSVEAARHAVGRIADITADKHMEGVRVTRWLLSPVPTFRLWRRMKLWELRSYEQVIKLEQDRLVYRARLQSVYGRAWRRKAPVESLMPLRLAKFGVPLAETAPAGLAAAGMDPVLLPSVSIERTDQPAAVRETGQEHGRTLAAGAGPTAISEASFQEVAPRMESAPIGERPVSDQDGERAEGEQATMHESPWFAAQHLKPEVYEGTYDPAYAEAEAEPQPAPKQEQDPVSASRQTEVLHVPVTDLDGRPGEESDTVEDDAHPYFQVPTGEPAAGDRQIPHAEAPPVAPVPAPRPAVDPANVDDGRQNVGAVTTDTDPYEPEGPEPEEAVEEYRGSGGHGNQIPTTLTVVDRYFLAWEAYIEQHGQEPTAPQLSEHLAASGIRGRNGSPIAPSTLRRYLLECRIYAVWAQFRDAESEPAVPALMEELARRGITGQYNRPLEASTVEEFLGNFRRRYRVFSLDMTNSAP